jgi:hypothetical protein
MCMLTKFANQMIFVPQIMHHLAPTAEVSDVQQNFVLRAHVERTHFRIRQGGTHRILYQAVPICIQMCNKTHRPTGTQERTTKRCPHSERRRHTVPGIDGLDGLEGVSNPYEYHGKLNSREQGNKIKFDGLPKRSDPCTLLCRDRARFALDRN